MHDERSLAPEPIAAERRPTVPRGGTARHALARPLAVAGVVLVIGIVLLSAAPSAPAASLARGGVADSRVRAQAGGPCNPPTSIAPSSLYVQQPEPTVNLSANGTITSQLEFRVLNYTAADNAIPLWFPSTYFTFPLATGSNFSYYFLPQWVNITGPGWSKPTLLQRTEVVPTALDFVPHGVARLTTQKVAILARTGYGNLTLEFRWRWSLLQPNATTPIVHHWSKPTNRSHGALDLPSIFYPAPYVSWLGGTGTYAYIGTNWTGTLGGFVAGRSFFLEMEYGGGFRVQDQLETAPANATTFNVSLPILNYNGYLIPGKVLRASFAPQANVTFILQPASCGSITFNGTKYANGSTAVVVPRLASYNFSIPGCKPLTFGSWVTSGALHVTSGHGLEVSGDGTFTIKYT
jgi:hypothetical protein